MDDFFRFAEMSSGDGVRLDICGAMVPHKPWYDDTGRFCASSDFRRQLAACDGQKLTVVIDSDGGDVGAGVAMYEALRARKGETCAVIVKAYSAATLPLMACQKGKRHMSPAGTVMIHRPVCSAHGNRREMQAADDFLRVLEESALSIYAAGSGKSRDELMQLMDKETFYTAQEAVQNGFADDVLPAQQSAMMYAPQLSRVVTASNEATMAMIHAALKADEDNQREREEILRYLESVGQPRQK